MQGGSEEERVEVASKEAAVHAWFVVLRAEHKVEALSKSASIGFSRSIYRAAFPTAMASVQGVMHGMLPHYHSHHPAVQALLRGRTTLQIRGHILVALFLLASTQRPRPQIKAE